MRSYVRLALIFYCMAQSVSCINRGMKSEMNIVFLHHSTGGVIWNGNTITTNNIKAKVSRLFGIANTEAQLPSMIEKYNEEHDSNYRIKEMIFPKASPYGWNNYPFDYYNIWVKNAGDKPFLKEPTLEILTDKYSVIIFKHCFPSSNIVSDEMNADINSDIKSLQNYKLQYEALRDKLHEFPDNKFILFTGAVQVRAFLTEEEAHRAREFHDWVTQKWDQPEDNIFLWDLYQLQTEDGLYFKDDYALSPEDSHPNKTFAGRAANLLFNRIIDVIDNGGKTTTLTGESI